MSSATLNQFFQDISQDPTLQQQFQEASDRESLVNKMVSLGNEKGYSITSSEADEWLKSMANQSATSGELSDDQLEAVAGGMIINSWEDRKNKKEDRKNKKGFIPR